MAAYTDTWAYQSLISNLDAEISQLTKQRERLAGIRLRGGVIKRKKTLEEERLFTSLGNRLKTLRHRRDNVEDLGQYAWPDLFKLWEAAYGGSWSKEEKLLLEGELEAFEGRGEKSLRHRLGLPQIVSQDSCDLPGDEEVKYVGTATNVLIRVSGIGRRAYIRALRSVPEELITDEMLDGEVSQSKVYGSLPEQVRKDLQSSLAPDKVLACYAAIYLTTETGFSRIPRKEFGNAFSLSCVTQYSPKYRLKREFVESKLRKSLKLAAKAA